MSNNLTGDYQAVLQISIRQINGLLGTLHQNAAPQDQIVVHPPFSFPPALQTPHSIIAQIAERRRPFPGGVFEDWVLQYQHASRGRGLRDIETELITTAPPGAARVLTVAFKDLHDGWTKPPPPEPIKGRAKLQMSSVTVSVVNGSSSELTVHASIRVAYSPDPGTTDLPAPIHGDVLAAFEVRRIQSGSGPQMLIAPSSQDAKFQFHAAPGSGLSASDENILAVHVRNFIRQYMTSLPVDLPGDFPFFQFKGLGSGPSGVIALPFQLSDAGAPASGVQPLTQSFIGPSGFAVAVSKDYVSGLIRIQPGPWPIPLPWPLNRLVTFTVRFTSGPTLTFTSGGMQISGRVALESPVISGWVSFTQLITLVFDPSTQLITPVRVGEPQVDESWFIPHGTAVSRVRSQIDDALTTKPSAPPEEPTITETVRAAFDDAKSNLLNGLNTFDRFPSVWYTGIEITPDGVTVRGEMGSGARRSPVVNIAETNNSTAFTAFESWIPAGRIDRFVWSWVEHSHNSIWDGVAKSFTDEHRFIFPKPVGAAQLGQICLRLEGIQILPGGQEVTVVGGTTCTVQDPVVAMDFPSWFGPLTLPIWRPGLTDNAPLRNAIAGHVSVQASVPGKEPLSRNVLVYFADWGPQRPLESLNAALGRVRDSSALMVIVVLPAGAFDRSRREIESKLPGSGERRVLMQFTEDDESGWTDMFAVSKRPSVFLINARREFVWKHEGEPNPAEQAAAIDKYQVKTSPPRFLPLRIAVSHGDPAPDARFETINGDPFVLHRFRGREVVLNFWQSWSAPCLTELSRLQRLHESRKGTPFIVAFHGGSNRNAIEEIRKRMGLSFALVQDSQQRIAQQFGVRCWPTTVLIGADGLTEHIQFGIAHDEAPPRQQ